jgi:NADH-quinone oxidoreductase subunit G
MGRVFMTAIDDPFRRVVIAPANDNLFSSGTLGRYSATLNSVMERHLTPANKEVAAD